MNNKKDENGLYRYMPAERGFQVLKDKKLRFNSPLMFNDPFDVIRDFNSLFDQKMTQQFCEFIFKKCTDSSKYISKLNQSSREIYMILKILNEIMERDGFLKGTTLFNVMFYGCNLTGSEQKNNEYNQTIKSLKSSFEKWSSSLMETWASTVDRTRILCFSSEFKNVPLWYHYADKYKGIVLSFNQDKDLFLIPDDKINSKTLNGEKINSVNELVITPVQYRTENEMLSTKTNNWLNFFSAKSIEGENDFLNKILNEKSIYWGYEKEKRLSFIMIDEPGYYEGLLYSDFDLNPLAINSVYLGPEIDTQNRNKIIALVRKQYPHVEIFQTKIKHYLTFEKII